MRQLAGLILALGSCLPACGGAPIYSAPRSIVLPVHRDLAVTPAGEMSGTLQLAEDCLVLNEGGYQSLPIWPANAHMEGNVIWFGNEAFAMIGQTVHLYGGGLGYEAVRRTMDVDIPEACQIGSYFLVGGNAAPCEIIGVPGPSGLLLTCLHAGRATSFPANANQVEKGT